MRLTAKVLGSVQLVVDGAPVDLGGGRQRRLLACLLVHRGAVVTTDSLVEAVFDGELSDAAWRTFRTYVARLRRALDSVGLDGATVIVTTPPGYRVSPDIRLDAAEFEQRLAEAQNALRIGDANVALGAAEAALGMWGGPAYGEFAGEDWARPEAVRLEEMRLIAREAQAEAMVESGRHDEAIAQINALIEAEPLRETPRRLGMLAMYRSGRHAEALRAGQQFKTLLAEETGLDWSGTMAELERMIIDRDPRLDAVPQGRKLRGYVLGERIEETDVGVTYRASQPAVGRDVAVTVIPAERADDPDFIRRFEVHAQRIASIEHPNVVPLYDYWREPGGAYLVSRHLTGGTLAARLRDREVVDEVEARRLILEVAAGLQAAHDRGVVHGRLGADAVHLDDQVRAYVTGFRHDVAIADRHLDVEALGRLIEHVWERVPAPTNVHAGAEAAVASVVERAAAPPGSGFASIADLIDAFTATAAETAASTSASRPAIEGPNPYRGLQAFREADTEVFFGRSDTIDVLTEDLRRDGVLVIVGASGAGKSSVVAAGLLPRLREVGAFVATMVPGRHPLAELDIALSRVARTAPHRPGPADSPGRVSQRIGAAVPAGGHLVLVVDQLEEVLTLSDAGERDRFVEAVVRARAEMGDRLSVVASARADFLGRLLEHPVLGPLVRDHSRLLAPLTAEELFDCIVAPAASAGVAVEPELASALVADAVDEPGSLPMLQFALTELYEHRVDGTMTLDAYRRMGGLSALIAHRADEVYSTLTPGECNGARRLFTRLVTLGEGAEDTRRRVDLGELAQVPAVVVDRFGAARLLTFDRDPRTREPTVEIAHEALIRHWPRLRRWIDDDRAGQRVLRHLSESATAWEVVDHDSAELYRGNRLSTAEEWASDHADDLTESELKFLAASVSERDAEVERSRRRRRRLRTLTVLLAVLVLVAAVASVIAVTQRNDAQANERQAENRAVEAEMQRLIAESQATLDEDPDLPLLLALEAFERAETLGIEPPGSLVATLHRATQSSRILWRGAEQFGEVAIAPDGTTVVAVANDGDGAVVVDGATGGERFRFASGDHAAVSAHDTIVAVSPDEPNVLLVIDATMGTERRRVDAGAAVTGLDVDPTGSSVVAWHAGAAGGDERIAATVFDTTTWSSRGALISIAPIGGLSFDPDGRYLAAQTDADIRLGEAPAVLFWGLDQPDAPPVRIEPAGIGGWSPDGRTAVLRNESEILFVDAASGDEVAPRIAWGGDEGVSAIDANPVSGGLLVVRETGTADLLEPDGSASESIELPADFGRFVDGRFTADGSAVVLWSAASDAVMVVPLDGRKPLLLRGNRGANVGVDVALDGRRLVAFGDTETVLWDLTTAGPAELGNLAIDGVVERIGFTPDGSEIVVSTSQAEATRVRAIDPATGDVTDEGVPIIGDDVVVSESGVVAYRRDDQTRVQRLDGTPVSVIEGCDAPTSIDDQARWMLLGWCSAGPARVVDPMSGDTVAELETGAFRSTFGPSGTISEGLVVLQAPRVVDGEWVFEGTGVAVHRMPSGEQVGWIDGLETREFWWPLFSADGEHIVIGSGNSGGWAIDVRQMLDGVPMEDAVVANPRGDGSSTGLPDVAGGRLVATQGDGEVLRFWDLSDAAEWMTLPRSYHDGLPWLRTSPDGRQLYYADTGVVRRLPLDPAELAEVARARVQRDFFPAECLRFDLSDCPTTT